MCVPILQAQCEKEYCGLRSNTTIALRLAALEMTRGNEAYGAKFSIRRFLIYLLLEQLRCLLCRTNRLFTASVPTYIIPCGTFYAVGKGIRREPEKRAGVGLCFH